MTDGNKKNRLSESSDSDVSTINFPATAAFSGYRPFPSIMNLYGNFSGILEALKTQKLCGATENDILYLVEVHYGYTTRGPLHFGQGLYLRNGATTKDPILAAAGDELPIPYLIKLFDPKTAIKLPPLDTEKNPRDMVTEILRASTDKEHGVTFRFAIEVGMKKRQREEFEWRKVKGPKDVGGHETQNRYTLYRPTSNPSVASSSSAPAPNDSQIVAELAFRNVMNVKHIFTLELLGAGLTGELGDRWTLMVVMTSLGLHWVRQNGKSNKAIIGAAQMIHSK